MIRLTNEIRTALKALVVEKITFPELDKAEAVARKAVYKALEEAILRQYPQKDMQVLQKYSCAGPYEGWYIVRLISDRRVDPHSKYNNAPHFERDENFTTKFLVCATPNVVLNLDATGSAAYEAWEAAKRAQVSAREKGHADYNTLITQSRSLEQIEKVWPAAKAVRAKINRQLPVIVLDDVIKRIAADQKARA